MTLFVYVCDVPHVSEEAVSTILQPSTKSLLKFPDSRYSYLNFSSNINLAPTTQQLAIERTNRRILKTIETLPIEVEDFYLVYTPVVIVDEKLSLRMFNRVFGKILTTAPFAGDFITDEYMRLCRSLSKPIINFRTGYPFLVDRQRAVKVLSDHASVDFVQTYNLMTSASTYIAETMRIPTFSDWKTLVHASSADAFPYKPHIESFLSYLSLVPFYLYTWRASGPELNKIGEMVEKYREQEKENES